MNPAGRLQHGRLIQPQQRLLQVDYDRFHHDPPTLAFCGRPRPARQRTAGRGAFQGVCESKKAATERGFSCL
jgi:hypothetical protein